MGNDNTENSIKGNTEKSPREANLKPPWKQGESGNPEGRPKKFVNIVLDELRKEGYKNISRSQVVDIYETLTILPEEKLREMTADKELPMFYRIISKEILGNRGFETVERLLDRAHGKPVQKIGGDKDSDAIKISVVEFIGGKPKKDKDSVS